MCIFDGCVYIFFRNAYKITGPNGNILSNSLFQKNCITLDWFRTTVDQCTSKIEKKSIFSICITLINNTFLWVSSNIAFLCKIELEWNCLRRSVSNSCYCWDVRTEWGMSETMRRLEVRSVGLKNEKYHPYKLFLLPKVCGSWIWHRTVILWENAEVMWRE